jgi:2-(acetamidomethylene)succinate hydrolase
VSAATVEGAGVELAYDERGAGQPVVLVHGTAATRSIWDEVREELGDSFRTIAYDRRAYGESGAPEGFTAAPVPEHGDDLIALIRRLDLAPALLCGHSFGAMTALDVVLREPELVRAAVLVEPPMLWLASNGTQAISELRAELQAGVAERGSAGAIEAFSRVVCGPQALDVVGRERAAEALRHPRAFASDLNVVASWDVALRDLRAIDTPVTMVAGTRTPRAYREPAVALAGIIPGAELREADTGHLVQNEAPAVVADALRALAAQP